QNQSLRLSYNTQKRTHDYLGELSENINQSRDPGLPTWEEMYLALTSESARVDATFGLGRDQLQTNFYKQHVQITTNADGIAKNESDIESNKAKLLEHTKLLDLQGSQISQVERSIADLNAFANQQKNHVNKVLEDYDGRIASAKSKV